MSVKLERTYCLQVGHMTTALTEDEARELYDALHAEFGDKQPIGFPVPHPLFDRITNPMRPPFEVGPYNPCDGPTSAIPVVESPAATGPSLQDDIERMVTGHRAAVLDLETGIITELTDEDDSPHKGEDSPHKGEDSPHNEPPSPDQSWQDRLRELWGRYIGLDPNIAMKRLLTAARGSKQSELQEMSSADLRAALREMGFDMPEPASHAERAAMARAAKLARNRDRLEPPKVEAPAPAAEPIESTRAPMPLHGHPLEVSIQLIHIHALARSARRRWPDDERSIRTHIEDLGPLTQLRKVSDAAIALFDSMNRVWLDAYTDLPPFKQRDVDASLLTEWKRLAA